MGLTAFPNGVSSFGIPQIATGSIYDMPTGQPWFVCNRAGVVSGDGTSRDKPFPSIADAVAKIATTNPSLGDWIFALSGHAENVTASNVFSASLVNTTAVVIPAGTRIIGEGTGTQRPALTFTAAASTVALAAAGSTFENMQLLCPQTGVTTVAAMVTVTAAGCRVVGNDMQMSSSATALCTTGIATSSAAASCLITDNVSWGITGTPTSWLAPTGTVGANRIQVLRNNVQLPLAVTTSGCIDLTANSGTAPIDWVVADNTFANKTAASTVAIKGVAGCGGTVAYNQLTILAAGAATAITTPGNWVQIQNFLCQPGKNGILTTNGGAST